MKNNKEVLDSIIALVQSHFTNWPVATTQQTVADVLTFAAHHPTVKEWSRVQWQNSADTVIQQSHFHIQLLQLLAQANHVSISHLIPIPNEQAST